MERVKLRLLFFSLAVLMITQPGAIAFANFDAPYGFYKDLSAWLSSYLGGALILMGYGILKRKELGTKFLSLYGLHYVVLFAFAYFLELKVIGDINPSFSAVNLLSLSILGFLLSMMLFLPAIFSPPYYPYDAPLLLIQLALWIASFYIFLRFRELEKEKILTVYRIFLGLMLFSIFFGFLKVAEVFG
ncbi:hypothetical protein [Thermococcus sp. PK]|uniref:hypothetical protein n=1 Tax=Thermococcus sp. PK TaxID=913025 RepID=UPI000694E1C6|nr:hypothetical protein [Thermococcus sp. PK]